MKTVENLIDRLDESILTEVSVLLRPGRLEPVLFDRALVLLDFQERLRRFNAYTEEKESK